jgi:hypothetical protein
MSIPPVLLLEASALFSLCSEDCAIMLWISMFHQLRNGIRALKYAFDLVLMAFLDLRSMRHHCVHRMSFRASEMVRACVCILLSLLCTRDKVPHNRNFYESIVRREKVFLR